MHGGVPLTYALDGKIAEVADEGVSDDFGHTSTDCGVLDRIIDVANETDTMRFRDLHLFGRRELIRRHNAHMGGHEVERCSAGEVARAFCENGQLARVFIVEEEELNRAFLQSNVHEWLRSLQQMRVRHGELSGAHLGGL